MGYSERGGRGVSEGGGELGGRGGEGTCCEMGEVVSGDTADDYASS